MKEKEKLRKLAGLCILCGKKLDRKGSYCIECNNNKNDSRNAISKKLHEQGICPCCKEPVEKKGAWFCKAKTDKLREQSKARRIYRKENNLCIQCGKPSDVGSQCRICLDKRRLKENKKPLATTKKDKFLLVRNIFVNELIKELTDIIVFMEDVEDVENTEYNKGYIDACNELLFKFKKSVIDINKTT